MNNEIGRKITSLTLMTIMLAAGFTAFAPSAMQSASAANANLFVSAEQTVYENRFGGPMVIEVVVADPDLSDTNVIEGEPDVTLNGKDIRMAQTIDGNWVGYFASRSIAQAADQTGQDNNALGGTGLDFGVFCTPVSATTALNITFNDAIAVTLPLSGYGGSNGTSSVGTCTAGNAGNTASTTAHGSNSNTTLTNVVREAKELNPGSATSVLRGQIGIQDVYTDAPTLKNGYDLWPFIQLYDFNSGENVVVQYNKAGGVQSATLKFTGSMNKFSKADLDRTIYPRNAHVFVTITDPILNVDPTDEDVWIFGTNSTNSTSIATVYMPFDEDGRNHGSVTRTAAIPPNGAGNTATGKGLTNIKSNLNTLKFETTGIMKIDYDAQNSGTPVLAIRDTGDNVIAFTGTTNVAADANLVGSGPSGILGINTAPVSFTEYGQNSGIFGNFDNSDVSTLRITPGALRGTSATLTYNEVGKTILAGHGFAFVDIQLQDAEWNSGEKLPFSLTDMDANLNAKSDEDLDLYQPTTTVPLIPSLRIGTPFTLGNNGTESANTILVGQFARVGEDATGTSGTSGVSNPVSNSGANKVLNLTSRTLAGQHTNYNQSLTTTVQKFSDRALVTENTTASAANAQGRVDVMVVDLNSLVSELDDVLLDTRSVADNQLIGFNFFNYDIRGVNQTNISSVDTWLLFADSDDRILGKGVNNYQQKHAITAVSLGNDTGAQGLVNITSATIHNHLYGGNAAMGTKADRVGVMFNFTGVVDKGNDAVVDFSFVADFFSFGYTEDGLTKASRVNNAIYRIEAEETGDNTSVFIGALEYIMLNQLNILNYNTYSELTTIGDSVQFIVNEDQDGTNAPRVNYNDLGQDGVTTQVSDQEDAPAHSGIVSFDKPTYKVADTVIVTVEDQDLNVDSDLIDIYTTVNYTSGGVRVSDPAQDLVGKGGLPSLSNGDALGRLLDITFDDRTWLNNNDVCTTALVAAGITDVSLSATGFSLIETDVASGIFTGNFQVPAKVCRPADSQTGAAKDTSPRNTQGLDMEVNYVDFRDASGQIIEVGDGAGIRANTGSVSLDRTVYPVPWGDFEDFANTSSSGPSGRSLFPVHATAVGTVLAAGETIGDGILTIHVQVNDPDFDVSAAGEDKIAQNVTDTDGSFTNRGPVKVTISRGTNDVVLGYAGGDTAKSGVIDVGGDNTGDGVSSVRQFGAIIETSPTSGIFEFDVPILYTDGPSSALCPATNSWDSLVSPGTTTATETNRFDVAATTGDYCILQGDILTVEYTDPADASGNTNTVTDSATFDLRNGALQSDKSVYIIGSDMILTLIEPDFDLDSNLAEAYDLDLIEWDSDAATTAMGNLGVSGAFAAFDPEPSDLRETGDSTGIFQIVIEIPKVLNSNNLQRGEEIVLEYTDWGPSGADYVGQEDEDINLTIFTSNFGATVELDQKVYTWTDKVYITIVAPDHNFDSNLVDEIGETTSDPIKVATRGHDINRYRLVETGTDTGIFTGEVTLTGFLHDADGNAATGNSNGMDAGLTSDSADGTGPTDGFLGATDDDGLTVSFEFSEDETIVGSALIRWNIGEVSWLEASYPASGTGVVRVIDPDMNLNPEAVDNFNANVWSDSDAGGIDLTVTETNEATGIFEGTVFFTTTDDSSGHRLRVAEGDTVTAEYQDNTLPDPYTTADELDITGTAFIGTVVPPLERAPASNARVVDAFGNTLDGVSVDQQVQITADLTNGQDREQPFAYLVQIQDENGVTVSLAWITGSLSAGQSFSPALSWIPTTSGTYTATVFVWESVDNPTALSPTVSVDIDVS